MSAFLSIIKTIGGPGSWGFLVAGLMAGAVAYRLWPDRRRLVHLTLGALLAGYGVLAVPATALAIIDALPPVTIPSTPELESIDTLVVFDGDNLAGRQRRAVSLLRYSAPGHVYLLGADYLLGDLKVAMAPSATLHHDVTTWNTADQVDRVTRIVDMWPSRTTAVIASRIQMPRIAALLQTAGTRALLVPSALDGDPAEGRTPRWRPSFAALRASRDAIYEHAALAWYRWRGDIR